MSLDQLIAITTSLAAAPTPAQGFNIDMFVGNTAGWLTGSAGDLFRTYTSAASVLTDFLNTTPEYLAAQAAFSQSPPPATFMIGKAPVIVAGVQTLVFGGPLVAANVVNGNVNGVALAPTTYATSVAATLTALAALIAAVPGVASATSDGSTTITITAVAGYSLSLSGFAVTLGAGQVSATVNVTTPQVLWSTGIAAIRAVSKAWYGFQIADRTDGSILDVAAWAEAQNGNVTFGATSGSAGILNAATTTDVASKLQALKYNHTFLCYHAITTEHLAAAWTAQLLGYAAGSANWMWKVLPGITPDPLTETQRAAALAKNCNIYTTLNGTAMTEPGITVGGQYIDVILGMDWLKANLQTDILNLQMSSPKIPYTDAGAALIESKLRTRVSLAQSQGIVALNPAPVFVIPLVAAQSVANRSARSFPNITVGGNLAGAINGLAFALTFTP